MADRSWVRERGAAERRGRHLVATGGTTAPFPLPCPSPAARGPGRAPPAASASARGQEAPSPWRAGVPVKRGLRGGRALKNTLGAAEGDIGLYAPL